MYHIKLHDYVPKPVPVTTDRILAAHYYPAWKKGSTSVHHGFDDLHDYPERTPLCGYYDGASPVFCDWEIKWALEHGINCMIYCWYRQKENMGKPVTVQDLRLGETLHEGFFEARYQSMMKFAIMFECSPKWGAADADDLVENLMPFWIENYFSRDNYLKIDNKPVLFVYDWYGKQLSDCLGSPEAQKAAFDRCREVARAHGFDGMLIGEEYRHSEPDAIADFAARGYDFCFPYCLSFKETHPTDARLVEYQLSKIQTRAQKYPDFYVHTLASMWDPTPRFTSMPHIYSPEKYPSLWKLSPNAWRRLLHDARKIVDALPEGSIGRKMVLFDNWNEWDEGHYILPSVEFGFQYLQAIREEWTARDNLPDYRMPQQLGTPPVNTEWAEPDLSGVLPHLKSEDGTN